MGISVRPLIDTQTARYRAVASIGAVSAPLPPEIGRIFGDRGEKKMTHELLVKASRGDFFFPYGEKERGDAYIFLLFFNSIIYKLGAISSKAWHCTVQILVHRYVMDQTRLKMVILGILVCCH
ncbi:hypothetical protein B296_00021840 [Ensete ventricosum]|uniref:Uncharacterized protein n=1 Tax=Ensete ventricosum TaxID=4639 RepID=A0A427AYF4_ENSVE|nr:hypothetical protein B296_00021840 [Ensete ventricosum]